MGTKPRIALIGLVLAGITLCGCESDAASRRPLSQSGVTASAARTTTPSTYPTSAWGSQAGTTAAPVGSTATSMPATQSARMTDPGMAPGVTSSTLSSGASPVSSPMMQNGVTPAASQTTAQFPGIPVSATSTGGMDPSGRITNPTNVPAPAPQATWPSGMPAASGAGMKTADPSSSVPPTQSSYQTRYPELQPPTSVPTMPKPGQSPNE